MRDRTQREKDLGEWPCLPTGYVAPDLFAARAMGEVVIQGDEAKKLRQLDGVYILFDKLIDDMTALEEQDESQDDGDWRAFKHYLKQCRMEACESIDRMMEGNV